MNIPSDNWLLLRQKPGKPCEVVYVQGERETVLFSGKRWDARRYYRDLRLSIGWEVIPAFVEKRQKRKGFKPVIVQCDEVSSI